MVTITITTHTHKHTKVLAAFVFVHCTDPSISSQNIGALVRTRVEAAKQTLCKLRKKKKRRKKGFAWKRAYLRFECDFPPQSLRVLPKLRSVFGKTGRRKKSNVSGFDVCQERFSFVVVSFHFSICFLHRYERCLRPSFFFLRNFRVDLCYRNIWFPRWIVYALLNALPISHLLEEATARFPGLFMERQGTDYYRFFDVLRRSIKK